MTCIGHCEKGLIGIWLNSEKGKTLRMKIALKELGYENVRNTAPIPGENERLIIGNYKGKDKSTHGVFIGYFAKKNEERIEISAIGKERAEAIERRIKIIFPKIDCKLRNPY